jgi:pyruvate formate lyase activating enzyme
MNIDLKSFSNAFYSRLCQAKLEPVLDTIRHAKELGIWIEITTLVIPGQNDSEKELKQIAEFIASVGKDIPWHISAFHPQYQMQSTPQTPPSTLVRTYEIGQQAGLKYIYVGNVIDKKRSNTYCPECGQLLIMRQGYQTTIQKNFESGTCLKCQTKIPGVWN